MKNLFFCLLPLSLLMGCSSTPEYVTDQSIEKSLQETAKGYTDTSGTGVLDDEKVVIVPEFKVVFQTAVRAKATRGKNYASQGLILAVDPKVLQEITDDIYKKHIANLKKLGYTIIEQSELQEKFPEFKKYYSEKMKNGPIVNSDDWTTYTPTGMKMDQPASDPFTPTLGAIFGTNVHDVTRRACDKLDAIKIAGTYIVHFANPKIEPHFSSTTVSVEQGISVAARSNWNISGKSGGIGAITLEKNVSAPPENYGTYVDAKTAGDNVRSYANAIFHAWGVNESNTNTSLLQADPVKYKSITEKSLAHADTILTETARIEKD